MKKMILLVDDDNITRPLIKKFLQSKRYEIIEAKDGAEALKIFKDGSDQINLVLTDIDMPIMDGEELINHIRLQDSNLPIIAMSGREHFIIGANIILKKPFELFKMENLVEFLLK